jgi:hypothetical protein
VVFKRGVAAKDLRPFSVEDPLGQGRRRGAHSAPSPTRLASPSTVVAPSRSDGPARAGAPVARLGGLMVLGFWLLMLIGTAGAWVPELLGALRPHIERALAKWGLELEQSSGSATPPEDALPAAAAAPPEPPPAGDPAACAPGDPMC